MSEILLSAAFSRGGVSGEQLSLATATPADVLKGKTFYSGDVSLKTGTFTKKELHFVTNMTKTSYSPYDVEIDVSTILPNMYKNLTDADFVVVVNKVQLYQVDSNIHAYAAIVGIKSYSPVTGILVYTTGGNTFNTVIGVTDFDVYALY